MTETRKRLGPISGLSRWPLVSIVVLNRDGEDHLRRLLGGLVERTDYPRLELIVVDNGSSDGSLGFLRSVEAPFPISILANPNNESFSDANNQGAEIAAGELLLFLNNDVEPLEPGWLHELVACLDSSGAGVVGARLVYPDAEGGSDSGFRAQEQEVRLRARGDALIGSDEGPDPDLFGRGFGENREATAVIGACMLTEAELFRKVGGFTHGYYYGAEDFDLLLKLREQGRNVFLAGRALLIHHVSSTSRELLGDARSPGRGGNRLLLIQRWGPRIWREFALGRLEGGNLWSAEGEAPPGSPTREEVLAPGFCVRADGLSPDSPDARATPMLTVRLRQRRHRCHVVAPGERADVRAYAHDVAIYLRGPTRHIPAPGQLNVLWALGDAATLSGIECDRYDLAVTADAKLAARLREGAHGTPVRMLEPDNFAESLIDATLERVEATGVATRIGPPG